MQIRLIIGGDGSVAISVEKRDGLAFEDAKAKLQAFQEKCKVAGAPIEWGDDIEQHLHDATGQHVLANTGQAHNHHQ
jgi:hypothetical protein